MSVAEGSGSVRGGAGRSGGDPELGDVTVIRERRAEQVRGLDPQATVEQALLDEMAGVNKEISNVDYFMTARGLHLLHLNVRSLLPKITEIRHLSKSRKVGIFCFTETWLDDSITDAEIELENYLSFLYAGTILWNRLPDHQELQGERFNCSEEGFKTSQSVQQAPGLSPPEELLQNRVTTSESSSYWQQVV
ncbi:hypothetical protein PO909_002727 [Leuciscus waleckii]